MEHLIKNFSEIATTMLRRDFLEALERGISEIVPEKILAQKVKYDGEALEVQGKRYNLAEYANIFVIGIGKAALRACRGLEKLLGDRITSGLCIDTAPNGVLKKISYTQGTHPLPSIANLEFSKKTVALLESATESDIVIAVISGGGSAMLCYPESEVTSGSQVFKELTAAGATISDLNIVRKHLSLVKGGGLAKIAHPATVISLILSDVPGDNLATIASGPTVKDISTGDDAKRVLERYGVSFSEGLFETPKEGRFFERVSSFLVCSNRDAMEKIAYELRIKNYEVRIHRTDFQEEARRAGRILLDETKPGEVLLTGGETFVRIAGGFDKLTASNGKGGRNQEVALGALEDLKENELVISFASDGIDNTDAAGAIADAETVRKIKNQKLKIKGFLENNDSYNFFRKTGDLIITGATGVNVSDLILTYKGAESRK